MNNRYPVHIQCHHDLDGWRCTVVVGDDQGATTHQVTVTADDVERLAQGELPVERLVEVSFRFLLERESRESILRAFELSLIGRYFPEYEQEMHHRLDG